MIHYDEPGAGQGAPQVDHLRVVGAGGVGAQEYQRSGPTPAVGDRVDVSVGIRPVRALIAGHAVPRLRGQPGLEFYRAGQNLRRKGRGVDGSDRRRA